MVKNGTPTPDNGKPIVALDIDGTLGDYHGHFLRFAAEWYGRPMPDHRDINPGLPLHRFMGSSKATYRQCKLAYRQGGLKRSMPVYPGARELTVAVRKLGAEVWICTTRPYLRLDNIDPDTRHWLRRNALQHDAVLWGEYKYRDLVRSAGAGRVVAVLDDLPSLVSQARGLGLRTYLRAQPYNDIRHWRSGSDAPDGLAGVPRIADLHVAKEVICADIVQWKQDRKVG